MLRPGNAGANTAADQIDVRRPGARADPRACSKEVEILVRADSAGATHDLVDHCRERGMRFSVG